jgi:hypothetical protein
VSCAAAGSLLLGAAVVAARQGVAEATTTEQMVEAWDHTLCTRPDNPHVTALSARPMNYR